VQDLKAGAMTMTPTQTQIMRNLLDHYLNDYGGCKDQLALDAETAITAAAEVGPKATTQYVEGLISCFSIRPAPLSKAGVAWESGARQGWQWALERIAAAERERCAQVAVGRLLKFEKNFPPDHTIVASYCATMVSAIINDIRALKDEP
jgi:hypothetical protein